MDDEVEEVDEAVEEERGRRAASICYVVVLILVLSSVTLDLFVHQKSIAAHAKTRKGNLTLRKTTYEGKEAVETELAFRFIPSERTWGLGFSIKDGAGRWVYVWLYHDFLQRSEVQVPPRQMPEDDDDRMPPFNEKLKSDERVPPFLYRFDHRGPPLRNVPPFVIRKPPLAFKHPYLSPRKLHDMHTKLRSLENKLHDALEKPQTKHNKNQIDNEETRKVHCGRRSLQVELKSASGARADPNPVCEKPEPALTEAKPEITERNHGSEKPKPANGNHKPGNEKPKPASEENQAEYVKSQTEPTELKTTPAEHQTTPAEHQTTSTEHQTAPAEPQIHHFLYITCHHTKPELFRDPFGLAWNFSKGTFRIVVTEDWVYVSSLSNGKDSTHRAKCQQPRWSGRDGLELVADCWSTSGGCPPLRPLCYYADELTLSMLMVYMADFLRGALLGLCLAVVGLLAPRIHHLLNADLFFPTYCING